MNVHLQLVYARILNEGLLVPFVMYGNETRVWRKKERSRIRAVDMDSVRGLLGIWRISQMPNTC